jgi:hypothetical protein
MSQRRYQKYMRRLALGATKRAFGKLAPKLGVKKFNLSHTSDFSDIENSPEGIDEIQKLVSQAGLAAASEAKAVGIPRVFARDNKIIREYPDGRIEVLAPSIGPNEVTYYRRLKSDILHVRKK